MIESPTSSKTISVALVDDHHILTDALALAIGKESDLRVAGVADSCAASHELFSQICPDVVLLDVALADGDGLSLVPELRELCPQIYILVLTSFADEKTLLRAIESGVNGFVSKSRPLTELLIGIRQAAEGEIVMPTSLLLGLLARTPRTQTHPLAEQNQDQLTPREAEILMLLAQGKSGSAIAAELKIAPRTVRTHLRTLLDKLGVHSRLEAVTYALRHGLIRPPL